jgi:hypothetical protein
LKAIPDRMPRTKSRIRENDFVAAILHRNCSGALLDLVRFAGHYLLKQVPDDLKKHGIGWRTPKHGIEGNAFPEHALVKRICDLLGIAQLDVYFMAEWRNPEPIIGHSKGSPVLILCPEVFNGLQEPEKAFVLGRALGPLKLNLELFRALPPDEVGKLILGALKAFDPNRSFPGEDERPIRAVTKAIAKDTALHAPLAAAQATLWSQRRDLGVEGFRQGVLLTASRVGLMVSGGMRPASRAIASTNMSLRGRVPESTQGVIKIFREIPELPDLCAYAISAPYLELRERTLRTV